MLIVIALALAIGLAGAWVYAGLPLTPAVRRKPVVRDGVSSAPARGASTARP